MEYVIAYRLRNGSQKIRSLIESKDGWTYRNSTSLCDVSKYRISTEERTIRCVDEKNAGGEKSKN